jgi:basic amino acid/polyamine antiporter, APA family
MIGALNGWVLLQGQMPLAMARDGAFPAWFGATTQAGTPARALLLSSSLASLLVIANYSRTLAELWAFMALLATVAALILYLICGLAALRLMATRAMPRSAPLAILAIVGTLYAVWTLFGAGWEASAWGALLLASGVPVYLFMRLAGRSSPAAAANPAAPPE